MAQQTIAERVARVEERIEEIRTNHLPHIDAKLDQVLKNQARVDVKMAYWAGGAAVILFILNKIF